jgi:nitrous oxidase accessory protein
MHAPIVQQLSLPDPVLLPQTATGNRGREGDAPDAIASMTIVLVAAVALVAAWMLPWWVMKARAPQYGQRTLVVEVGPRDVGGDVHEIDMLGHYVGIRPMRALAQIERHLAPLGMLAAFVGLVVAPWLRRRWMRFVAVLPALIMPLILLADLKLWMAKAANERDPNAALNLTVNRIDPKLFGAYDVGQFKVETELGGGFYVASLAGLLGLGLVFAMPLPPLRRRHQKTAAVIGAGLIAGLASVRASAADLVVGAEYATVAQAVAAAQDGDTVIVGAGVHHEHVVIDNRVRLIGRPGAVIDGGDEGTVLRITASGTEVRGLTVRNSGSTYNSEDAGIRIDTAADVRILDTRIEDTLFGIFAVQADRCVVEGSTIIGKALPHVRRGDGIRLWYSSGCRLIGNQIERSRDLIIWYSADTTVEDNVVRTSRYGLHYMYSNNNVFRRNRFEDNQVGAAIMYSRGIELRENAFSFSRGPSAYGLLLKDADDVFIVENRFIDNATGLFFDNAPQAKDGRVDVHANLIARGEVGIALQPLSQRIRFWENAFIGNRLPVQVLGAGSADRNVWDVDGRGNYWSDAVPYDANRDGVSEIAYRSESTFEDLADRYPTLQFFADTPGAEAIDLAARSFPIFLPRPRFVDAHPLVAPPLTDWTRSGDAVPSGSFIVAGAGLLSAAVFCSLGARALLS